jgi:23S rRNA (guanine745-N1)-methyltransferase
VIDDLICAVCGAGVQLRDDAVRCGSGHSFDVARQGYVSMLAGRRSAGGDDAAMVAARDRVLAAGHLEPLAEAVAGAAVAAPGDGCVVDAGAGTGRYLARVLDALPGRAGIALDASAAALRRAARCHPRAGAVACDVWAGLPVRTGAAGVVLNVFAPRNGADMRRVLGPGGGLVVATPTADHLRELVETLGLLRVDETKEQRVDDALGEWFVSGGSELVEHELSLAHAEVADVVAMGPSARHVGPDIASAIAALPEPVDVTASVTVSTYVPRP